MVSFNDNVRYVSEEPEEDTVTTLVQQLQGIYRTERTDLGLSGKLAYYDYRVNDDLNNIDKSCDFFWNHQWLPRFLTSLRAGYIDDQRRDRTYEESGLITVDSRRQRQDYSIAGQYGLSEISSISLAYGFQQEAYDDPTIYDMTGHAFQVGIHRQLGSMAKPTIIGLKLLFSQYGYSRDFIVEAGLAWSDIRVDQSQDAQGYALSVDISHQLTELIKLEMELGSRYTQYNSEMRWRNNIDQIVEMDSDDSRGFVGSFSFLHEDETTHANIRLSHDFAPASGRSGLTERSTLSFATAWYLSGDFQISAMIKSILNRTDPSALASSETDELTVFYTGALRYVLSPNWSLQLQYNLSRTDDRIDETKIIRNSAGVTLGWNLPVFE